VDPNAVDAECLAAGQGTRGGISVREPPCRRSLAHAQCPTCGVYDTRRLSDGDGRDRFRCLRVWVDFEFPRHGRQRDSFSDRGNQTGKPSPRSSRKPPEEVHHAWIAARRVRRGCARVNDAGRRQASRFPIVGLVRKERFELSRYCYRQPLKLKRTSATQSRPRKTGVGVHIEEPIAAT
jgi:hypothetical protein